MNANVKFFASFVPEVVTVTFGVPVELSTVATISPKPAGVPSVPFSPLSPFGPAGP